MSSLDSVLFCVWGFPEPSQTFIHRELEEMERRGAQVHMLASHRVDHPGASQILENIAERAIYLGSGVRWSIRGLAYFARHPFSSFKVASWMVGLPHRTPWHRLRAFGLVIAAASVATEVKKGGYRYIHAHFAHHAELAMALSRFLNLPWGATMHAVGIWRERNLLKEKVESASLIMTCTSANRQELLRHAPDRQERVHLVYHGLQKAVFQRPTSPPSSFGKYVAVGRLVEKKGFEILIQAWSLIGPDRPRLIIIGGGPLRARLLELIKSLGLDQVVELVGPLQNSDVLAQIAQSRALIAPSVQTRAGDQDGIPNVIVEAMALGRPVVASALSGIPEVVVQDQTGVLVSPGSAQELAAAVTRLQSDDELVTRLGREARIAIESAFCVEQNVDKQLELVAQASRSAGQV